MACVRNLLVIGRRKALLEFLIVLVALLTLPTEMCFPCGRLLDMPTSKMASLESELSSLCCSVPVFRLCVLINHYF